MPQDTGGGGGGGPNQGRGRLTRLVSDWKDIRERIQALLNGTGGTPQPEELESLREQRAEIVDNIQRIVGNHPGLRDDAIDLGFRESLLPSSEPPRDPDDLGGNVVSVGDGKDGKDGGGGGSVGSGQGGGGGGGQGGGNDDGGPNHNLLPGKKGQDYRVVKLPNGQYRVLYRSKLPGSDRMVTFSYAISEKDLKSGAYGITMKDVQNIGKQKGKGKFYFFGNVDEIKRGNGGNVHPHKKFLKLLVEQHPNASWMNSREVMRIMLQAKVEGRGSEWTDNMLRQTKWWQKRTAQEREWEMLGGAEQEKQQKEQQSQLVNLLDGAFGPNVKWQSHVKDEQLERWSTAVASGRVSVNVIANRIQNIAERIEGTSAWTGEREDAQALSNSLANYDNAYAFVRDKAIEWLGYHGRPDAQWLEKQAKRIAAGAISQEQLETDLRTKKQALYGYLAPDETWMSRASTYKNVFEQLTGTTIGYDDRILRDFSSRDKEGTPNPERAMSLDDFERYVKRYDSRWRNSDAFVDQRSSLTNLIQQTFTGLGGGF